MASATSFAELAVQAQKQTIEGAYALANQVLQHQKAYALKLTEIFGEAASKAVNGGEPAARTQK